MDHERVNISRSTMSCGAMELSRIGDDTEDVLYAIGSRLYHASRGEPCAFFIFSDRFVDTASSRLVNLIRINELGRVETSQPSENPHTGNVIVIYVWMVNHSMFKQWYSRKRVLKLGKVGS